MFVHHLKPHKQTPGSGQRVTGPGCGSRCWVPSEAQGLSQSFHISKVKVTHGLGKYSRELGKKMGGARERLAGSTSILSSLEELGTILLCAGSRRLLSPSAPHCAPKEKS